MTPYQIIEHTADVGIRVTGPDMETFFLDAARGMFGVISDEPFEGWDTTHEVSLKAPDIETLLVDWLSELLYLFEVKKLFFSGATFKLLDEHCLQAMISGVNFSGAVTGTEIKAVTYHQLEVRRDAGFEAVVYFDL